MLLWVNYDALPSQARGPLELISKFGNRFLAIIRCLEDLKAYYQISEATSVFTLVFGM